jgi:hypothetical protein
MVAGTCQEGVALTSGRFAMIADGVGFVLVPWTPALERHRDQQVSGVAKRAVGWTGISGASAGWRFDPSMKKRVLPFVMAFSSRPAYPRAAALLQRPSGRHRPQADLTRLGAQSLDKLRRAGPMISKALRAFPSMACCL